jgi:hypothetical protein
MTTSFKAGQGSSSKSKLERSLGGRTLGDRNSAFNAQTRPSPLSATEKRGVTETIPKNIPNFHPDPAMDDDEDLTAENPPADSVNASFAADAAPEPMDPETKAQSDAILKHINNLKFSQVLAKRVESLIALNDII